MVMAEGEGQEQEEREERRKKRKMAEAERRSTSTGSVTTIPFEDDDDDEESSAIFGSHSLPLLVRRFGFYLFWGLLETGEVTGSANVLRSEYVPRVVDTLIESACDRIRI